MKYLFKHPLENYQDWVKVYQSIEAFKPLIEHIYQTSHLTINHLTPGTNAVFKVNDTVIKIFAPTSTNINHNDDFKTEINNIKRAKSYGILTPSIIKEGIIEDRYHFEYIIFSYIEGLDACIYLKSYPKFQKIFVKEFYQIYKQIQFPCQEKCQLITKTIHNHRLDQLSPTLKQEIINYVQTLNLNQCYYLHGDLNGQNIRINDHQIYILDFADTIVAPIYYDYPVIIFDLLFNYNDLIQDFIQFIDTTNFTQQLFDGLCIHEYGADFIKLLYESTTHKDIQNLTSLQELKQLLTAFVER